MVENNREVVIFGAALLALLVGGAVQAQEKKPPLPLVKIVATGGTIAHISNLPVPNARISGEALVGSIPQLRDYARIEVVEFSRVASNDLDVAMLVGLSNKVNEILAAEPEVAGVVVTMGSNATEEAAYLLNLTVKSDKPVVFTAAQLLHGTLGADGDRNLLDAVRVAVSPQAQGKGVLVVTNEEIQSARDVRKTVSHRVEAWNSGDLGDLGLVDSDRVSFYRCALRKHTKEAEFDIRGLKDLPRVDILYTYVGADGILADEAVEKAHAEGLVLAAFPTGAGGPQQGEALEALAKKGMVVVDSHRGGRGRPVSRYPDLLDGDNLTPQHARILLMLALTRTHNRKDIKRMFEEY